MKAELIPEETFTLVVAGERFEGMRVASRWNGLVGLRNVKGEVLIVSAPERSVFGGAFDTLFNDIFRTAAQTKECGTVVVMGSPDLVARLRAASAVPQLTDAPTPPTPPAPPRRPYG